ncbi:SWIM zinc finger family protein [Chlorobium sp. N1]|uniref:SWIM zinc finger family protein n=1 Tax=Chlorobium sp. N1 TaxID=2491138 RepID=UPI00103BE745|nr:SWIM zinc finger family protein [Chlorobium sp. N1]TCD47218.1 hypothetical protein E0L29_09005 [Chlorobium sp. N1]
MARFHYFYEPTTPKKVDNGIKAQSRRGAFARQWWGKAWIAVLERFNDAARLARGRAYARKGQVTDLQFTGKGVVAKVQGSRSSPYRVTVRLRPYAEGEWQRLVGVFRENPVLVARILGGEMPEEIEALCRKAGLPLFPAAFGDIEASCSCPDYAHPCKHLAAVFYLLAEAFDRDPFLLFALRGIERDALFTALGANRSGGPETDEEHGKGLAEPLPADPALFWSSPDGPPLPGLHEERPADSAILARRLGPIPFWRSERDFLAEIHSISRAASEYAFSRGGR